MDDRQSSGMFERRAFYFAYRRVANLLSRNRVHVEKGNVVDVGGTVLRNVNIRVSGEGNVVRIGPFATVMNTSIVVKGRNNKLEMGCGCIMHSGSFQMYQQDSAIVLDESSTIRQATFSASQGTHIRLGRNCMLGFGIQILAGDGHTVMDVHTREVLNKPQSIAIGDRVWLGSDVVVLKGVTIGVGSIVGIRSVVTKDMPENSMAVGIPAKVVRENVFWLE